MGRYISYLAMLFIWIMILTADACCLDDGWFASIYVGELSDSSLIEEIAQLRSEYESGTIFVLSVGRTLGDLSPSTTMELEGQLGLHEGIQNHQEISIAFALRHHDFPWNHLVETSFAIAEGLSYATEKPEVELVRHNETSKLLNYLYLELEFSAPEAESLSFFTRIHHRSGIYGLFGGVSGGSNAVGGGVRYRF